MSAIQNAADQIGDAMYAQVPDGEVMTDVRDGYVEIVRFIAGVEGRGDGTRAMKAACETADRLAVTLTLVPDGSYYEDEAGAEQRLRAFYSRFGFVADGNRDRDRSMVRIPH